MQFKKLFFLELLDLYKRLEILTINKLKILKSKFIKLKTII
mgnify:CR=1 FL=1